MADALVLDGIYRQDDEAGRLRFVAVPAPSAAELEGLVPTNALIGADEKR